MQLIDGIVDLGSPDWIGREEVAMRTARIVEEGAGYYHLISRVVGREFVFHSDEERERFRLTLRAVEAAIRILAAGMEKKRVESGRKRTGS